MLTDLFFRPYTRKMWELELEALDASVMKRIPLRFDDETRYFPEDRFQLPPRDGYAPLFAAILDHRHIRVTLGQAFDRSLLTGYVHCFNSMPIDVFFDQRFGRLPYRSMRFHHQAHTGRCAARSGGDGRLHPCGAIHTGNRLVPAARPTPTGGQRTVTREEPCDYWANGEERYYPVRTSTGGIRRSTRATRRWRTRCPGISFIRRCGTYQHLYMYQVINQSLAHVVAWRLTARTAAGTAPAA